MWNKIGTITSLNGSISIDSKYKEIFISVDNIGSGACGYYGSTVFPCHHQNGVVRFGSYFNSTAFSLYQFSYSNDILKLTADNGDSANISENCPCTVYGR